ncbi:MAG: rhodanese-like domain-containing protein [Ignavibacteria bacterium]|nr:rhodanese-like domain-containing protein [Ignavibacteria bacterium]
MTRYARFAVVALPVLLFAASCADNGSNNPINPAVSESELLAQALEGSSGGYINTDAPAVVTAQQVFDDVYGARRFHLIDLRSSSDHANGHVLGAVNVKVSNLLAYIKALKKAAAYDKVVLIDETGQSAAWSCALLRSSGYGTVFSLAYGMSSWHTDFNVLTQECGSQFVNDFTVAVTSKPSAGTLPTIATGKTTAAEILAARVDSVFARGYSAANIDGAVVMRDPKKYFVVTYLNPIDYAALGHIPGSVQYTPKVDLKSSAFLKTLPKNQTIVLFDYDGQSTANLAAVLGIMGYDVRSIHNGGQTMIYQTLQGLRRPAFDANVDTKNFPYVR